MSKTKILFSGLFLAIFMVGNAYSGNIGDVSALSITFEQNPADQYQLAKSTFLPETYDDLGLSGRHNTKYDFNKNDCSAYPLKSCPSGSKCDKCPVGAGYRLNSCTSPYILSGGTCACPATVTLTFANDKCIKYCDKKCIEKVCAAKTDSAFCTNGTQSCDNGCGGTFKCCIACTDTVTTKPANSSYTYSSCKDDDGTKNIQTGWTCNAGYHKYGDNLCDKDCNVTNCAGFTLTSCPANGTCSTCTKTAANCSTDGKMYKLDSCATGYSKSGDACVKAPSCETCAPGKILFSDGTCFSKNQTGKAVTGIVLSTNPNLVMSTYSGSTSYTGSGQSWITTSYISGLTNHSASSALNDMNGKNNTALIKAHGTKTGYYYLPIDYALSYSSGSIGKGSWFIPSGGQAKLIGQNKSAINQGLSAAGYSSMSNSDQYWTSSGTIYTGANPNTQNYFVFKLSSNSLSSYGSGHTNQTRYVAEFTPAACNSNSSQDNTAIGDILYSDMTTSYEVISGKTPIGIVFDPERKRAIALEKSPQGLKWFDEATYCTSVEKNESGNGYFKCSTSGQDYFCDVPELTNMPSGNDMNGEENTLALMTSSRCRNNNTCNGNWPMFPAASYAYKYKTEGTQAGDWYLPAIQEMAIIRDDLSNGKYSNINIGLNLVGKESLSSTTIFWASTEYGEDRAHCVGATDGLPFLKYKTNYVLPAINYGKKTQ